MRATFSTTRVNQVVRAERPSKLRKWTRTENARILNSIFGVFFVPQYCIRDPYEFRAVGQKYFFERLQLVGLGFNSDYLSARVGQ